MLDINGDKIPELFSDTEHTVYLINKGKVIGYLGDYMEYNSKSKQLHIIMGGLANLTRDCIYKVEKNSVKEVVYLQASKAYDEYDSMEYYFGHKKISENEYYKLYKKYVGSKKWKEVKTKKKNKYSYAKMIKKLS